MQPGRLGWELLLSWWAAALAQGVLAALLSPPTALAQPALAPDCRAGPALEAFERSVPSCRLETASPVGSPLDDCDVVAYYGHPATHRLGILGEYPKEELLDRPGGLGFGRPALGELAAHYDALNGPRCVRAGFHLIYATVQPGGRLYRLPEEQTRAYIRFAEEREMVVILDHQLGILTVEQAVVEMLPFLSSPVVHLAMDPEWHTVRPAEEIGWVGGAEVNLAQAILAGHLEREGLGRRFLIVHQFTPHMIPDRELIRADFPGVDLVHMADGYGSPAAKLGRYQANAEARNLPLKGFKLFYVTPYRTWGFDFPLLTPQEVLGLEPAPVVITYQ